MGNANDLLAEMHGCVNGPSGWTPKGADPVKHAEQLDLALGRKKRDAGIAQTKDHNSELFHRLLAFAIAHSQEHGSVTSDDVRKYAAANNLFPKHRNFYGSLWRARGWVLLGYKPSEMEQSRARKIGIWCWK